MEPTVRLRLGDLFDGPADLIVLPCSTSGTITGFVARSLVHYAIPHPTIEMELGDVEILPFDGADDIAQYVAFAASVHGDSSTTDAVHSIGAQLGNFTRQHASVRTVSAPLLGSRRRRVAKRKSSSCAKGRILLYSCSRRLAHHSCLAQGCLRSAQEQPARHPTRVEGVQGSNESVHQPYFED